MLDQTQRNRIREFIIYVEKQRDDHIQKYNYAPKTTIVRIGDRVETYITKDLLKEFDDIMSNGFYTEEQKRMLNGFNEVLFKL